ncbi:hypothetical protein D1871_16260 [Nakamurella silvestris]|nr:hypothetical protein D1871_16260 [Nakamurella silvestris]
MAVRWLGGLSGLLIVLGGWAALSGTTYTWQTFGPVTFSLDEIESSQEPSWFDIARLHQFNAGVDLVLVGIVGFVVLLGFLAWRSDRQAPARIGAGTGDQSNGFPRMLIWLAIALALVGAVLVIGGIRYQSQNTFGRDYLIGTGWWDTFAPRTVDLGLISLSLAILSVFAWLALAAWRWERRAAIPVVAR